MFGMLKADILCDVVHAVMLWIDDTAEGATQHSITKAAFHVYLQ